MKADKTFPGSKEPFGGVWHICPQMSKLHIFILRDVVIINYGIISEQHGERGSSQSFPKTNHPKVTKKSP